MTLADGSFSQCTSLGQALPGSVFYPNSSTFTAEVASYFSAQESGVVATCRVSPVTASEVAQILAILKQNETPFSALFSFSRRTILTLQKGGHMTWPGSANIAAPGVAVDLHSMNTTTVSGDKQIAYAQPGGGWGVVYDTLEPQGLIVVGGRSMTVGVGSCLDIFPGGISFMSPQYGFASDNIINYEVVTADAEITNANKTFNSDLYWALRVGSTNFGIVTRYDLQTYPDTDMWGGFRSFNLSYARAAGEAFVDLIQNMEHNVLASGSYNLGSASAVSSSFSYMAPDINGTDVFNATLSIPFLTDTTRGNVDMQNIVTEIDNFFPVGARAAFYALAFKPDVQFMLDMHQQGLQIFSAYNESTLNWGLSYQPFSIPMLQQIEQHDGPQNLTAADGPFICMLHLIFTHGRDSHGLIVVNLNAFWTDSSLDADINSKLEELISWGKGTVQARGIWNPWIYLNYAPPAVNPYLTFGEQNLQKLETIRQKYDPDNVFEKLWPGGFKL
ncbi:hypothetical protein B0H11DRAFT_1753607 [Mycena galericulata]|nr:hypothetical protein B0H11DRAFT_1753607 [Mycena galericulata]